MCEIIKFPHADFKYSPYGQKAEIVELHPQPVESALRAVEEATIFETTIEGLVQDIDWAFEELRKQPLGKLTQREVINSLTVVILKGSKLCQEINAFGRNKLLKDMGDRYGR